MKVITMIFLTLFMAKGCTNEYQNNLENTVVQYTANTRGFFQKVIISNKKMSISRDRNGNTPMEQFDISDKDWNELVKYFQKINLEEIPNLKDPTQKRFYDGAAIADLKIRFEDKNYETTQFDHGFPPKEIEEFVNKIVSLAKPKNDD